MAQEVVPTPKKSEIYRYLLFALLPVFVTTLALGMAGMLVLMDEAGKYSITHSQFGVTWKKLIHKYPAICLGAVNGSMLVLLLIVNTLWKDSFKQSGRVYATADSTPKPKARKAKKAD